MTRLGFLRQKLVVAVNLMNRAREEGYQYYVQEHMENIKGLLEDIRHEKRK